MLIETQRLIIRDLASGDERVFAEMASDGSLNDIGFDANCGTWIAAWLAEAKQFALRNNPGTDYLAYTIILKEGNQVIGSVGCSYYEDLQRVGIVHYIGAEYRNKGYATEAVRAYTKHFFACYDIRPLIATIRAENIPSWKVVEKVGFLRTEQKMYQDINDSKEELYYFYEMMPET